MAEQNPHSAQPRTIPPVSGNHVANKAANQARQDVEAILAEKDLVWPKTPENVKGMSLDDLIERVKALNEKEDLLRWELEHITEKEEGKKRVQIRGKMLDVARLRRNFGEYIQMHEDVKGNESGFIETKPARASHENKERPGYVYLGRFQDDELWIEKEEKPALKKEKKIAS